MLHRVLLAALLFCSTVFAGEGGTLKGTIEYDGEAPPIGKIKIDPTKKGECKHDEIRDEAWVVEPMTKGLKWAIVRIMGVKLKPEVGKKLPPVKIDQTGCVFTPYAMVVSPGQSIEVLNPESIVHNFHIVPLDGENIPFSRMTTARAPKVIITGKHLSEPEMIVGVCDIHPWMKCYIAVHDPRFAAITGAEGTFEIKDIPLGKYKVIVTHNAIDQEKEIEIKAGQATVLEGVKFKKK